MYRYLLGFSDYKFLISEADDEEDLDVEVDSDTGEKVVDKKSVSKEAQIKVLAKRLYKLTIKMGRFQSTMQDKIMAAQQNGADENAIQSFQELLQGQMEQLQTSQMDTENQMMMVAGNSPGLSDLSQRLSSEAKILANKKNKEYFDKKVDDFEKDIVQAGKAKQAKQGKGNDVPRGGGKDK